MKKLMLIAFLIAGFAAFGTGRAMALNIVVDGDFNFAGEWEGSNVGEDGVGAGGYVGPGWGGQAFDVEYLGLQFDGNNLYFGLQTGFDPVNGSGIYDPGDFALDVDNDGNYDYALDFSFNSSNEVTFSLYENPVWIDGMYNQHAEADPFENTNTNDLLASFGGAFGMHSNLPSNVDGGISYVLEGGFDMSLLTGYTGGPIGIHWTMECGNDFLNYSASPSPVPEPASMILLGSGLLGLAAAGRRKRKASQTV